MTQTVEFEGVQHEFPDDFTPQDIQKALASAHPMPAPAQPAPQAQPLPPGPFTQKAPDGRLITRPPTPAESKPMAWGGALRAGSAGALQMATFGQAPKLAAKFESAMGNGSYDDQLAQEKTAFDKAQAENPGASAVGGALGTFANPANQAVGSVANQLIAAAPRTGLAGAVARYGTRMGQGAVTGAGYGAGFAPPGQAKEGAVKGAIGGAATAGVMQAAGDLAAPLLSRAAPNTVNDAAILTKAEGGPGVQAAAPPAVASDAHAAEQQLFNRKQELYKASESAGATVTPDAFKEFVDGLPGKLKNFRPRLAPETANLLEEFQSDVAKGPRTLSDLDELRQLAAETAKGAKPNDIRLITDIKDHLDDFMDGLKPSQLVSEGADPYQAKAAEGAVTALKDARAAARSYYKLRDVNDLVETGENLNNPQWTKNQFAAIVRRPQKLAQYTDDEQDAIKEIARTGDLRKWIKLIPLRGVQMTATYADPVMQRAKIGNLQNLIASGGSRPQPGSVFGSSVSPKASGFLNAYGGLAAAQLGQRRQANAP